MTDYHDIIIRPVLSEKSYDLIEDTNTYTFLVRPTASKHQIRDAVEQAFGVDVAEIRTLRRKGKLKRQGRTQGYTPEIKKAYVTLAEGSKGIPFFDSLGQ